MEAQPLSDKANTDDAVDNNVFSTKWWSSSYNTATVNVPKNASYYETNFEKMGMALIFNHENFDNPSLPRRIGSNIDRDNLKRCLKKLNFDVRVFNDFDCDDVLNTIDKVSKLDHSDCLCILVFVLTRSENNRFYAKDTTYNPELLWTPFTADNCKTLAGKPKLFFIQGSQGEMSDSGLRVTQSDSSCRYKIPVHADFLLAYSFFPGYLSWKNTSTGSWFVQALCEELEDKADKFDLITLLTFVNRRVALEFESDDFKNGSKQAPYVAYSLTRLVYLNRKYKPNLQ